MDGTVEGAQKTETIDKLDGLTQSLNSAVASASSKLSAAEEGAVGKEQFIFTKQWYPVAVVEFLDKKKPHPLQLMGKDLVMWLDVTTNKWNVFEDACPHRLAPLSEGRIEPDGTLLCTYHAWRFDAKGECTSIPHARKEREADLRVSQRRKVFAPATPWRLGAAVRISISVPLTLCRLCRRSQRRVLRLTQCRRRRGSCGCGGSKVLRAAMRR
jgi:nitrite reductase/ring-hydroxylating ferredoxin subunit